MSVRSTKVFLAGLLGVLVIFASVGASSVLAVEAESMIEDETFSKLGIEKAEQTLAGGSLQIAYSVGETKVTIECKKVGGSGFLLKGGTHELTPSLIECSVLKMASCTVSKPVFKAKTTLLEVNEGVYAELQPLKETEPLISMSLGAECAIGTEVQVKGAVLSKLTTEPTEVQKFTLSEAISKELEAKSGVKLTVGKSQAFLTTELSAQLGGARAGQEEAISLRTKLCKEQRVFCPGSPSKIWPKGTEVHLENEGSMRLTYGGVVIICTEAVLAGPTSEEAGVPLWGAFGTSFFAGCTSGGNECTAFVTGQPFPYSFTAVGMPIETMGWGAAWFKGMLVKLECPGARTCVYKVQNGVNGQNTADLDIIGGSPAKAEHSPFFLVKEPTGSELLCSTTGKWEGATAGAAVKFKASEPSPLWITS